MEPFPNPLGEGLYPGELESGGVVIFYEGNYFVPTSVALNQLQHLPGSPNDVASPVQPWGTQSHLDDPFQLSPPGLQVMLLTETQEAASEPPPGSAPAGEQFSCETCGHISTRPQEHGRHIREVHGLSRPCPLCSRYQWKRGYKIKDHLLSVHDGELDPEFKETIRSLKGQGVVNYVEAWNSAIASSSGHY
ncbi:hypothetical protein EDB84DRAFT_1190450 [Lactarius hengduanensis]|nr:hypothetical protein EDB84DRAFT_1190450 [Lactarius hengduanensis]